MTRPRRVRPRLACLVCTRATQAACQMHPGCRPAESARSSNALPEGRWVPNGRGIVMFRRVDGLPVSREDAA